MGNRICATALQHKEMHGLQLSQFNRVRESQRLIKQALQRYGRYGAIHQIINEIKPIRLYSVAIGIAHQVSTC